MWEGYQIKWNHWCETWNYPLTFHLSIISHQQWRKTDVMNSSSFKTITTKPNSLAKYIQGKISNGCIYTQCELSSLACFPRWATPAQLYPIPLRVHQAAVCSQHVTPHCTIPCPKPTLNKSAMPWCHSLDNLGIYLSQLPMLKNLSVQGNKIKTIKQPG